MDSNPKLNHLSPITTDTEAGTSCNWMGLELVYPELKTHINYVFKIRNGTYWTARRYAKSGLIEKRFIEECPFCRNIAPETIEHMLLECSRWQALRANILAQYINIYRAQELMLSSTRICKDPTVLCVKTTLGTEKFLNAIALPRYLMLNSILLATISPNQCPSEKISESFEYEVHKRFDSKIHRKKLWYLIERKNYAKSERSWVSEEKVYAKVLQKNISISIQKTQNTPKPAFKG
ncbi:hypothetical protein BB561_004801 [Smittium simulii]|uniref:Uncharacterized protein n=1 Tax=Smittium simulii TaxID=133385 RepID=A0A2T9YE54_9FUNG|nr:hypothetical protein BB561_004801 [Smittium simulii]